MSAHWYPAYVGLGSNLDDPMQQIRTALSSLRSASHINLQAVSSLYVSEPHGEVQQDDFVNAVAALLTTLTAEKLLEHLHKIETAQGRERIQHWGPRTLDLDLLVYADQTSDNAHLRLPHPEIANRNFVLVPLAEIAPALLIPGLGRVVNLLDKLPATKLQKI
ncbi:MAG: 2-amino-4-hydroxy-6-hydroxymethyldihydropteridine diphosphokinase [Gammaproteobacteria bacterium]|nr:2-amino-4-hydroxy-6-hydroxymethyldihydropteridine diphosphokinase [Gammaproteobacteria bacterium]NNC98504.1 2-amino-4-hydroxy-6-hydroxymethyldihydropteridine diphosphokinase [Gammaproteobacteria bacterium]NNM13485.1 2-amino-4-hydroxy-6-hydroxymethyldihydropteridine diphosphokinase [Gammaproteobacteria bacterium]